MNMAARTWGPTPRVTTASQSSSPDRRSGGLGVFEFAHVDVARPGAADFFWLCMEGVCITVMQFSRRTWGSLDGTWAVYAARLGFRGRLGAYHSAAAFMRSVTSSTPGNAQTASTSRNRHELVCSTNDARSATTRWGITAARDTV